MEYNHKNPYQMNLVEANKTKLYNQSAFWTFNTAKYRALLSNDPTVIKHFYKFESKTFGGDIYEIADVRRSFYYSDECNENAEEFFGIIPMICESIAKMVCGSGYDYSPSVPDDIKGRLNDILKDNDFDRGIKTAVKETMGLGDAAWHVFFDPMVSDYPIIELVPAERLLLKRSCGRITEIGVKQQVMLGDEPQPFELHVLYSKRRKGVVTRGGAKRYVDDGVLQRIKVWDGSRYLKDDASPVKTILTAYGMEAQRVLPLCDLPVVYLPNTLDSAQSADMSACSRPYGIVFGLESVSSALDEILSNAVDTVRKSFPFLLIDAQMIPSNLQGDKEQCAFSTRRHSFVMPKNVQDSDKLLQQIQAKLNTTEFVEAAKFQINIALNKAGINAATLGLQLSGHVEAEATQNAKERNSIRTRNTIATDYESYLSKLFAVLLQYDDYINGNEIAVDHGTGDEAYVAHEYKDITVAFRKYIVDTPEEVSEVLARKVQGNLMSIFAAVREQHPDWDDESIYDEANLIYAEKQGMAMQVEPGEEAVDDTLKPLGPHKDPDDEQPDDKAEDEDKADGR